MRYLGIECGGTRTVVLFGPDADGRWRRAEFGPANLRLLDDAKLVSHFQAVKRTAGAAFDGIAIGMAGARGAERRMTARPPSPKGVAMAVMVSSSIMGQV